MAGERPLISLPGGWLPAPCMRVYFTLLLFGQERRRLASPVVLACTGRGTCPGLGWARGEQPTVILQPCLLCHLKSCVLHVFILITS